MVKLRYIALTLLLLLNFISRAHNYVIPQDNPVVDYTSTLTDAEIDFINWRIRNFTSKHKSQIAVVIIPSTDGEPIENISLEIAEDWGLGRKGIDDGVLLLIAKNDRKLRIEVGYGLEGAITDVYAGRIIDEITKDFKSGHFYDGINIGLDNIMSLIIGEELPMNADTNSWTKNTIILWLVFLGLLTGIFFAVRKWWKNMTESSPKKSFFGKCKFIFTESKWEFLAYGVQTIIISLLVSTKSESILESFQIGGVVSSLIFFSYFCFRGFSIGGGGDNDYSSNSGGSSSSSSYSGGGGSFGGGGASGSW